MKKSMFFLAITAVLVLACCPDRKNKQTLSAKPTLEVKTDSVSGKILADTIVYDVIIKNANPDDNWTQECLKGLKKDQFINQLFESVYSGALPAYSLKNNAIITPDELREMERNKTIERDKIGKIQFTEAWIFNDSPLSMTKKVISVSIGSEVFDNRGDLLGYKHVFKLNLN